MKKIGYILVIIGLLTVILLAFIDKFVSNSDKGIGVAQLLGIEAGAFLLLLGTGILIAMRNGAEIEFRLNTQSFAKIFDLPTIVWVVIAFLIVSFTFFIRPMFLNSKHQMVYLFNYLPNAGRIGLDIRAIMKYIEGWMLLGQSPYADKFIAYPPLAMALFAPLYLVGYPAYFNLITFLTLASYITTTLIIPLSFRKSRDTAIILLLFVVGIFSYGIQFELERGQSNLIAFAFCISAIYVFHTHQKFRFFSYILFSISLQLKLYPAIFIIMFIDDWRDWKAIIKKFIGIGLFNFLLLFVLGYGFFIDFLDTLAHQQLQLTPWNGSSIRSFFFVLSETGYEFFSEKTMMVVKQNLKMFELLSLALFGLCLVAMMIIAYIRRINGFNPSLLIACTVGALIIPTISNDYKLPLLIAPMSLLLSTWPNMDTVPKKIISIVSLMIVSVAFWSTLYPFKYKPEILHNTMPVLLLILLMSTMINFIAPGEKANYSFKTII